MTKPAEKQNPLGNREKTKSTAVLEPGISASARATQVPCVTEEETEAQWQGSGLLAEWSWGSNIPLEEEKIWTFGSG